MQTAPRSLTLAVVFSAVLLVACAPEPYRVYDAQPVAPIASQSIEYGVVEAIEWYRDGDSRPTGLGAVIGFLVGLISGGAGGR